MPRICYVEKNLRGSSLALIAQANEIIEEYMAQGFDLTLRQLYYQFVSRDLIPNTQKEYKRLGSIINDARLAGLVDWDSLVDRTRNLRVLDHWESPAEIIDRCVGWYQIDKWNGQPIRPEVWIEKDALLGVISGVCERFDVPYFSCRGYTSQSEMWASGQRALSRLQIDDQPTLIIHLGDHDPSGIDMTRDIRDRLEMFMGGLEVKRIALNMDQVDEYNPPPNPAKLTDSRIGGYIAEFGSDSWELDALEPQVLVDLVEKTITAVRDDDLWDEAEAEEDEAKAILRRIAEDL
jgi:hypothetical protein